MKTTDRGVPAFPQVAHKTTSGDGFVFDGLLMVDVFASRFAADSFQLLDKQDMSPNDRAVAERDAVHKAYHRADLMMEIRKKYL